MNEPIAISELLRAAANCGHEPTRQHIEIRFPLPLRLGRVLDAPSSLLDICPTGTLRAQIGPYGGEWVYSDGPVAIRKNDYNAHMRREREERRRRDLEEALRSILRAATATDYSFEGRVEIMRETARRAL